MSLLSSLLEQAAQEPDAVAQERRKMEQYIAQATDRKAEKAFKESHGISDAEEVEEEEKLPPEDNRFKSLEEDKHRVRTVKKPAPEVPFERAMSNMQLTQEMAQLQIKFQRLETRFDSLAGSWRAFRAEAKAGKFGLDSIFNNVHEQLEAAETAKVERSEQDIQWLLKKLEASGFSVVKTEQLASMEQRLKQVEDDQD